MIYEGGLGVVFSLVGRRQSAVLCGAAKKVGMGPERHNRLSKAYYERE